MTFLLTLPGIIVPTRGWLKFSGIMVTLTALFTLVLGLFLWLSTLKTKEDFAPLWSSQSSQIQELMQSAVSYLHPFPLSSATNLLPLQFNCCGYFNSTTPAFVTDSICPSPAAAALMRGCATPIASFANVFVDDIFTAVFGMCGIDGVLILATACLIKDRKERERFRHIDEKAGIVAAF